MTDETTEITLSESEEKTEVAKIAQASIAKISEYKVTLQELVDKHKDVTFTDLKDKEGIKAVGVAYSETRQARLAITNLGKQAVGTLKLVIKAVETEVDEAIEIVSPSEKRFKSDKDRIDDLKEEQRQEELRAAEEVKQTRVAKLVDLGLKFNGVNLEIGDLSISPVQIAHSTPAQWEAIEKQATVEYEAVQLKLAEEETERKRVAEEVLKQQQELAKQNEAKQAELDKQTALIKELQEKLKEAEVNKPQPLINVEASREDAKVVNNINNSPVGYLKEPEKETILDEVFGTSELEPAEDYTQTVELKFSKATPFIDAKVGKSTLRIYTEQFLDEANEGLTKDMVAASGEINGELLFLVIKPK